jgi:hypothetical protein
LLSVDELIGQTSAMLSNAFLEAARITIRS